jgi:desulfoferrodoxin (superoxide reductase-like protein)
MMRFDIAEHKYGVLGNIEHNDIFELFTSRKMVKFRKNARYYGEKEGACKYCDIHGEWMEKACLIH